jgi:flagellar hook-associated protein 2
MVSSIGFSLGIGSGLDIKSLIEGLSQAERAPKDALLRRREEANNARISALADASAGIDSFASALSGLISSGSLFSQPSVSQPNLVAASALPGTRLTSLAADLEVVQLARSQTLQSALLAGTAAPVGQGDLTLTTATGSFTISIDATNDSLSGLAEAINGKNAGVTASVITDQGGARLILKGATGESNAFTLDVPAGTSSGLERFAYGPAVTGGMALAQAPQDAILRLDGVEVRRASNSIKDLIPGVQLDLKGAAPGTRIALGVTRPTASIEQAVGDFVSAYNELMKALNTATAPGADGAGGPLRGDLSVREMKRQLAELPSKVLNSQGALKTLSEIGVATNRDGSLSLNKVRLQSVLASSPTDVEGLFNPVQSSSSPLVAITSPMGRVKPGTYTLTNVVPASGTTPASGEIDGLAASGSVDNFLIAPMGSEAIGLALEVRGAVASATITIDPGLGGALQAIRDAIRARSGPVAKSQERLQAESKAIAADRVALEARAATRYDQLTRQFTAMERQVSAFKATQSYLKNQIAAWNSDND